MAIDPQVAKIHYAMGRLEMVAREHSGPSP